MKKFSALWLVFFVEDARGCCDVSRIGKVMDWLRCTIGNASLFINFWVKMWVPRQTIATSAYCKERTKMSMRNVGKRRSRCHHQSLMPGSAEPPLLHRRPWPLAIPDYLHAIMLTQRRSDIQRNTIPFECAVDHRPYVSNPNFGLTSEKQRDMRGWWRRVLVTELAWCVMKLCSSCFFCSPYSHRAA